MASSNIKLFDENKSNMKTDEEYLIDSQRLNGVQTGVASSLLQNKTLYQVSLVAYAIAQLMNANGYDANDSDAVSTFVGNLASSILQKVSDKATNSDVSTGTADNKWISPAKLASLFPLSVSRGGTGKNTLASGQLLVGNGTGAVNTRQILTSIPSSANTNIPNSDAVRNFVNNAVNTNNMMSPGVGYVFFDSASTPAGPTKFPFIVSGGWDTTIGGFKIVNEGSDGLQSYLLIRFNTKHCGGKRLEVKWKLTRTGLSADHNFYYYYRVKGPGYARVGSSSDSMDWYTSGITNIATSGSVGTLVTSYVPISNSYLAEDNYTTYQFYLNYTSSGYDPVISISSIKIVN